MMASKLLPLLTLCFKATSEVAEHVACISDSAGTCTEVSKGAAMLQVNTMKRQIQLESDGILSLTDGAVLPGVVAVGVNDRCSAYTNFGTPFTLDTCAQTAFNNGYQYISYQLSNLRCTASSTCDSPGTNSGWQVYSLPTTTTTTTTLMMYSNKQYLSTKFYGVWDRANVYSLKARPFLKGWVAEVKWSQFEPQQGNFDYSVIDSALTKAYNANGSFYAMVDVGPDSPDWIYNQTVNVLVQADPNHPGFQSYPYYLDATYVALRNNMINAFATYLRNHIYAGAIGFVQANWGCTGDTVLYKVPPLNATYMIDYNQTKQHMYEAWSAYQSAFQNGPGRVIPILINPLDDTDPVEGNFAIATFKSGMGIKGNAIVRGHHLSGERSWTQNYQANLLNSSVSSPFPFLFSRTEMDQTWTNTLAQINIKLYIYWGVINGLNQGLAVHDVANALDACYTLGFADSYNFFNLYAPQLWPMNATNAFIALHEGLDAADLAKFPAGDTFGPAGKNLQRITNICAAYSAFGCQIDDPTAALAGQVYQRSSQVGYNDVTYDIWPTNYGRWIEQIDADVTSQGLFRIGGNITGTTAKYARFARGLIHSSNKTGMYFKFSDGFFPTLPTQINMHLIWYDNAPGSFQVMYINLLGQQTVSVSQVCLGDQTWKDIYFQINNLGSRLSARGSDFSITSNSSTDIIIHLIEASRVL